VQDQGWQRYESTPQNSPPVQAGSRRLHDQQLLGFVGNETFSPYCLILDLGLPDMDGLAVLDRIRKDREQRLPVIG